MASENLLIHAYGYIILLQYFMDVSSSMKKKLAVYSTWCHGGSMVAWIIVQ